MNKIVCLQLSKYLIPRRGKVDQLSDDVCWATIVEEYLASAKKDRAHLKEKEPEALFYSARDHATAKFLKDPIGKNKLAVIGKEVAKILLKPNPDEFTGHCWRRSSATAAAESGATTMELRTHYDWAQDSMCKEYVDKSSKMTRKMASMLQPGFVADPVPESSSGPSTSSRKEADCRGQMHPANDCRGQTNPALKSTNSASREQNTPAQVQENITSQDEGVEETDPFDELGDDLLSQVDLDCVGMDIENASPMKEKNGPSQMVVNTSNTNPNSNVMPSVLSGLNFNNCNNVSFVINYNSK